MNWWNWSKTRRLAAALVGLCLAPLPLAAQTAAGKVLRVGVASLLPDRANPYSTIVIPSLIPNQLLFDSLLAFDADGNLQPNLVERWEMLAPDHWRFTLRDGIAFSNGEPLDAAAATAALTYLAEEAGVMEVVAQSLVDVVAATVVDRLVFDVRTDEPNVLLPRRLAGIFVPAPKAWARLGRTAFSGEPAGTGPFTLEQWSAGKAVFAANRASWRPPVIDRIEMLHVPDLNARMQALRTGAIDIAVDVGPDDRPLIEAAGGTLHIRPTGRVQTLTFVAVKDSPVSDVRVRQALNYAINKQAIIDVLLGGTTEPATQPAARQSFGYVAGLAPYPYDPDRARALLAEAGHAGGFSMMLSFPPGAMAGDEAFYQQLAADLAAVGVRATIETSTFAQHITRIRTGGWPGEGFGMDYNNMPALDALWPMRIHSCLWAAPWHCREDWVPLIRAAETATSVEQRLALTQELGRKYRDEPTAIFLWEMPGLDAVGPRVRGFASRLNWINFESLDLAP